MAPYPQQIDQVCLSQGKISSLYFIVVHCIRCCHPFEYQLWCDIASPQAGRGPVHKLRPGRTWPEAGQARHGQGR